MEISNDDYRIFYEDSTVTLYFQGSLRLIGMEEYYPIVDFMNKVIEANPEVITLDLCKLEFLNSSGISMISKFVIQVRQKKEMQMIVHGSESIPWQKKSLRNLQKLMPSLELKLH